MKKQLKNYFGLFILILSVFACSSGSNSNDTGGNTSETLQQVLMSGNWAGDACFDQAYLDILTSDASIFSFTNNTINWQGQIVPTSDATYVIQGNDLILYFDLIDPYPHRCFIKWRISSYTSNQITFNSPSVSDYHDCWQISSGLTCVPHLVKQ